MMKQKMILIGLGANLVSTRFGAPVRTLEAALEELERHGVHVARRSRWYSSAPVPPSGQPRYINGVAAVETDLPPAALLNLLHEVEREFGRHRTVRNAAREIDLDLLAYGDLVSTQAPPILPHPRLAERAFVLLPICDIDAAWRHPQLGRSAVELAELLAESADIEVYEAPES